MSQALGLNRRRLSRWLRFDTLPERNRMQPRPGHAGSLSRVLATAMGSGLPTWSNSFCGSAGARLRRLLLQVGGTPLPVASSSPKDSNAIASKSTYDGDDHHRGPAGFRSANLQTEAEHYWC